MTRADIINRFNELLGVPKKEAAEILDIILDTIKGALKEGESVKISGFGTFNVRKKGARIGRNPQTGVEIEISPRKVVVFKPSSILKERINSR